MINILKPKIKMIASIVNIFYDFYNYSSSLIRSPFNDKLWLFHDSIPEPKSNLKKIHWWLHRWGRSAHAITFQSRFPTAERNVQESLGCGDREIGTLTGAIKHSKHNRTKSVPSVMSGVSSTPGKFQRRRGTCFHSILIPRQINAIYCMKLNRVRNLQMWWKDPDPPPPHGEWN